MRNEIEKKCYLCGSEDNLVIIRNSPLKKEIGKMVCMDCLPKSGIKHLEPIINEENED
jgi:hypothetical protein